MLINKFSYYFIPVKVRECALCYQIEREKTVKMKERERHGLLIKSNYSIKNGIYSFIYLKTIATIQNWHINSNLNQNRTTENDSGGME